MSRTQIHRERLSLDIEYLLLLQQLREATGDVLSPFMNEISKIAVCELPILLICFVYWAFDRKAGRRLIGGAAFSLFVNGILKLVFCVYRPWIRDSRVLPYGDSIAAATGYSFPSGHSTWAASNFGGVGAWLWKNGRRIVGALFWVFVVLVLFSRNYLGVHTPQDVVIGFGATLLAMWAVCKLEDWTDEDPTRDLPVLIGGLVLVVAAGVFYMVKPYPMDYAADGSLIVDPAKMINDSFQGLGYLGSYVVCRYIERRGCNFDREFTGRSRIVAAIVALIPLEGWLQFWVFGPGHQVERAVRYTLMYVGIPLYALVIVPAVMGLVAKARDRK